MLNEGVTLFIIISLRLHSMPHSLHHDHHHQSKRHKYKTREGTVMEQMAFECLNMYKESGGERAREREIFSYYISSLFNA